MMTLLDMLKRGYQRKTFRLASGRESNFYIDCKQTILLQEGLVLSAKELLERLRVVVGSMEWEVCDHVAGSGAGGTPLAAAMSVIAAAQGNRLDMLYIRDAPKDHGTGRQIEPGVAVRTMRVVLVEDVITTGGSIIRAADAVSAAGYTVEGVLVLVDREEGGAEAIRAHGLKVESLYTKTDFLR